MAITSKEYVINSVKDIITEQEFNLAKNGKKLSPGGMRARKSALNFYKSILHHLTEPSK